MGAFQKLMGMKVGGKTVVEKIKEETAPKPTPLTPEQLDAQKKAAVSRTRFRTGRRQLLNQTRFDPMKEEQSTLG
jgi:hypothetical protein